MLIISIQSHLLSYIHFSRGTHSLLGTRECFALLMHVCCSYVKTTLCADIFVKLEEDMNGEYVNAPRFYLCWRKYRTIKKKGMPEI